MPKFYLNYTEFNDKHEEFLLDMTYREEMSYQKIINWAIIT